jgi:hypothetical protein
MKTKNKDNAMKKEEKGNKYNEREEIIYKE